MAPYYTLQLTRSSAVEFKLRLQYPENVYMVVQIAEIYLRSGPFDLDPLFAASQILHIITSYILNVCFAKPVSLDRLLPWRMSRKGQPNPSSLVALFQEREEQGTFDINFQ